MFCTDQTRIQDDYVEARDKCRELAELKLDIAPPGVTPNLSEPVEDKARKGQLVSLFSECMAQKGWSVPDGKNEAKAANAALPATAPAASAASPVPVAAPPGLATAAGSAEKAGLARNAECAFARTNASVSHIAALRAQACDAECAQRLNAAPGAPRPSACGPETTPLPASTAN